MTSQIFGSNSADGAAVECEAESYNNSFEEFNNKSLEKQEHEDSRRIRKLKQQVAKQNNFINDLKRNIRNLQALQSKSIADRENLAFLQNRLDKENVLLKSLTTKLINEQKQSVSPAWEQIRLCSEPLDDLCSNPWMLGNIPVVDQRFPIDSALSSLSSLTLVHNESCNRDRNTNDEQLLDRDRLIGILQSRVEALSTDVLRVKKDNQVILDKSPVHTRFCEADMYKRLRFYKDNTDELEKNLVQMGAALDVIRSELGTTMDVEGQENNECNALDVFSTDRKSNSNSEDAAYKLADDQYNILMQKFAKKSEECRKLTERLAKTCSCHIESPNKIAEEVFKERCSELLKEQEEFKILIKEQGDQLDEYRERYLKAQQKVEEQKLHMTNMDLTNNRIEEQINNEIQKTKEKFQVKLRHLSAFPNLLEVEEQKVKELKKSNENLFAELKKLIKKNKLLESRLNSVHASQNVELEQAHYLLKMEKEQLNEAMKAEKVINEQLQKSLLATQNELQETITETAKIIARANDRAQDERKNAQARIQSLELELAQYRASASVTINNRDEALREMQTQMKVLSGSFHDAQVQIESLRKHIIILQKE